MTGPLPLRDVRVVDLSKVWSGPACTRILADLGADVIKVESSGDVDLTRNLYQPANEPKEDSWNRSAYFTLRNAGKRAITLDLTTPDGLRLLRQQVAESDVLVENYTPRVMRGFGLGYETLRQLRPDLIMLSMSAYGQSGPLAEQRSFGMGFEVASGVASLGGYPDGPPLNNGNNFLDAYAGVLGCLAVLVALYHRADSGRGQHIDLSQQEAAVAIAGEALLDCVMNGRVRRPQGNRDPAAAPQGCYRCKGEDSWLLISVRDDGEWAALCEATGHLEWAADPSFAGAVGRRRHHDELDALIEEWTRGQEKQAAMHLLQRAGVPAAAVLNGKEVLTDEQLAARGFFRPIDVPNLGRVPVPRYLAAQFSAMDVGPRGRGPRLGEHNREVLQGALGVSDEEICRLEREGVIGTEPRLGISREAFYEALRLPLDRYLEIGSVIAVDESPPIVQSTSATSGRCQS
jgi:crotonobetainyl-CoA:carnitine CoA-transferase CaiB-like acyl-CoA transferase